MAAGLGDRREGGERSYAHDAVRQRTVWGLSTGVEQRLCDWCGTGWLQGGVGWRGMGAGRKGEDVLHCRLCPGYRPRVLTCKEPQRGGGTVGSVGTEGGWRRLDASSGAWGWAVAGVTLCFSSVLLYCSRGRRHPFWLPSGAAAPLLLPVLLPQLCVS